MTPSVDSICQGVWPVQDSISHRARKLKKLKELTHFSDIWLVSSALTLTWFHETERVLFFKVD